MSVKRVIFKLKELQDFHSIDLDVEAYTSLSELGKDLKYRIVLRAEGHVLYSYGMPAVRILNKLDSYLSDDYLTFDDFIQEDFFWESISKESNLKK